MKIITIDGPASSGKGTVAKLVAQRLQFNYLDSGAIYRALAYHLNAQNINFEDTTHIINIINNEFKLKFLGDKVLLNQLDVTHAIRGEKIGMLASDIGKNPDIRLALLDFQRKFASYGTGLVTDGRDMGSVVFPNADLKIFLTASAQVRANRRYEQLLNLYQKNHQIKHLSFEDVLQDIVLRDKQDKNREVAPLSYDDSFTIIDNSNLSIADTVEQIVNLCSN